MDPQHYPASQPRSFTVAEALRTQQHGIDQAGAPGDRGALSVRHLLAKARPDHQVNAKNRRARRMLCRPDPLCFRASASAAAVLSTHCQHSEAGSSSMARVSSGVPEKTDPPPGRPTSQGNGEHHRCRLPHPGSADPAAGLEDPGRLRIQQRTIGNVHGHVLQQARSKLGIGKRQIERGPDPEIDLWGWSGRCQRVKAVASRRIPE